MNYLWSFCELYNQEYRILSWKSELNYMEEHTYGGRVPSLSAYLDEVHRPENTEGIIQGLENFLREKYRQEYGPGRGIEGSEQRGIPETKAKQILGLQGNTHIDKLELKPPKKAFQISEKTKMKLLKEAVQEGYLDEVHLRMPWHPKPFLEGEIETFPYEHDTAILYRAVTVDEFFVNGGKTPHNRSALNDGYIKPGNQIGNGGYLAKDKWDEDPEDFDVQDIDFSKWSDQEIGIYMGPLNVAITFSKMFKKKYRADPLILELEVPTDKLHTLVRNQESRVKNDSISYSSHKMTDISNLQEFKQEFDESSFKNSIEAFRYYFRKLSKQKHNEGGIQFGVRHAIPLNWIRGIWNYNPNINPNEEPAFETFENVLNDLEEKYPLRIYGAVGDERRKELIEKEIKDEYGFLESINNRASNLEKRLNELEEILESLSNFSNKANQEVQNRKEINKLVEAMSEEMGYLRQLDKLRERTERYILEGQGRQKKLLQNELDDPIKIESLEDLLEKLDQIEALIHEIKQVTEIDMEKEKELAAKNTWSYKDLERERNFKENIDEELLELVEKVPSLRPLKKKIEGNKGNYVRKFAD